MYILEAIGWGAVGAGVASLFWIGLALYAMHPKREWDRSSGMKGRA